jgi:sugar lactone lactonase YvrE
MDKRIALGLFVMTSVAFGQKVTTFAGNGIGGYSGDGGPAASAEINNVTGLAADPAGNIYLADQSNNRVRKVGTNGVISTFAGTGVAGFSGDNGPALLAQLNGPIGVCVAPNGTVYVNDINNRRVRAISPSGMITTVAGNGGTTSSGDGGPATAASMILPIRCTVDPTGNLYIADQGANKIRKVDTSGNITTFAGTGTQSFSGDGGPATAATFNNPTWVLSDSSGNIYVSDQSNERVREITTNGNINTVAGNGINAFSGDNGPATSASLNFPGGLALDSAGSLYIVDPGNERIRKVTGGVITTVAGNGLAGYSGDGGAPLQAEFNNPFALAIDSAANLYIGDINNNRVRELTGLASGGSTNSQSYYFSDLVFGGSFQTTLTYINYSPQSVSCITNFYSDSGTSLAIPFSDQTGSSRTDTLAPGGSLHVQTIASLSAAVTEGWAQASCSGPIEAGLLYRLYSGGTAISEASINAETAPTSVFATFAQSAVSSTGIAYANPSTTQSATITLLAYNTGGSLLGSHIVTLGPLAHGSSNVGTWLGQANFTGFVAITSTSPIISLSLNAEAYPIFSSLPPGDLPSTTKLVGSAPGGATSAQSYYFSDLAFAGGFQTTLTYINYSPNSITCTTTFYSDTGAPLSVPFTQGNITSQLTANAITTSSKSTGAQRHATRTDTIPAGGSVHDQTIATLTAAVVEGWAQATCTGPVQASLLYRLYTSGTPVGEASINAETTPTTEFATFAQAAVSSTGIAYANPSTTQSGTVTFEAYNTGGALVGSHVVTLNPLAHGSNNVGTWVGQAGFTGFVKISSTVPIISLSLNAEAFPVFSSLPPGDLPSGTSIVP